ncbi:hypothetical protein QX249_10590 [Vibrio parahaemolyticus]|uniref:Uncharacterized protein n=1 Tax=Vibrio parahaemolyticus TaxID=670 RepID=A0AAW8PZS2_VIBPH|nr:hypothetical protein [Vibrio parahaemolyticus]MDS1821108.1 hypothetical protein [Vibrio parahaemolyticus]
MFTVYAALENEAREANYIFNISNGSESMASHDSPIVRLNYLYNKDLFLKKGSETLTEIVKTSKEAISKKLIVPYGKVDCDSLSELYDILSINKEDPDQSWLDNKEITLNFQSFSRDELFLPSLTTGAIAVRGEEFWVYTADGFVQFEVCEACLGAPSEECFECFNFRQEEQDSEKH